MEEWALQQALQEQQRETHYKRNERIAREQREAQRQIELAEIRRIDALRQAELRANRNQQNSSASLFDQLNARWQQERQRRMTVIDLRRLLKIIYKLTNHFLIL
jgi:hypothetical protein